MVKELNMCVFSFYFFVINYLNVENDKVKKWHASNIIKVYRVSAWMIRGVDHSLSKEWSYSSGKKDALHLNKKCEEF